MGVSGHTYSLLDEGSVAKRRMVRLVILLLTFIIVAGVTVPTYIIYSNSQDIGKKLVDKTNYNSTTLKNSSGLSPGYFKDDYGDSQWSVEAFFTLGLRNIDPLKETADVRVNIINLGDNSSKASFDYMYRNNFSFYFNGECETLNTSQPISEWIFPISLIGDPNRYPFDLYKHLFYPLSFCLSTNNNTLMYGITTYIAIYNIQTEWEVTFDVTIDDNGAFQLAPTVSRSFVTKGFSLFIVILLWVLSLCQFFIAAQSLIRNREIVELLLALPATLLFALPALRNVQPGVPPIGTYLDMAGFFWNMALVAISLITLCIMLIFQYKVVKN